MITVGGAYGNLELVTKKPFLTGGQSSSPPMPEILDQALFKDVLSEFNALHHDLHSFLCERNQWR